MRVSKIAIKAALLIVALPLAAYAQRPSPGTPRTASPARPTVQVFVPGNASGAFGRPTDLKVPLVAALTIDGPGTIQVTYLSGTVTAAGGIEAGPNGIPWHDKTAQFPLQEARGFAGERTDNFLALIGVFVPQTRVARAGFNAIDGTKNFTEVGIKPDGLFFIGESNTFEAKQAGTLFLGINDTTVSDNGGGFTVEVTGP